MQQADQHPDAEKQHGQFQHQGSGARQPQAAAEADHQRTGKGNAAQHVQADRGDARGERLGLQRAATRTAHAVAVTDAGCERQDQQQRRSPHTFRRGGDQLSADVMRLRCDEVHDVAGQADQLQRQILGDTGRRGKMLACGQVLVEQAPVGLVQFLLLLLESLYQRLCILHLGFQGAFIVAHQSGDGGAGVVAYLLGADLLFEHRLLGLDQLQLALQQPGDRAQVLLYLPHLCEVGLDGRDVRGAELAVERVQVVEAAACAGQLETGLGDEDTVFSRVDACLYEGTLIALGRGGLGQLLGQLFDLLVVVRDVAGGAFLQAFEVGHQGGLLLLAEAFAQPLQPVVQRVYVRLGLAQRRGGILAVTACLGESLGLLVDGLLQHLALIRRGGGLQRGLHPAQLLLRLRLALLGAGEFQA